MDNFIHKCSCHDSSTDHFLEIAKDDGYQVAQWALIHFFNSAKNTELELLLDNFKILCKENDINP